MSVKNGSLALKDYSYRKDAICSYYAISATDIPGKLIPKSFIYQNLPLNLVLLLKQIKNGLLCRLHGNNTSH